MDKEIKKFCENFAKNLKEERKVKNLTQKQVAEMINIKTQSYQAYESGVSLPTVENLLKLAKVLDLSLEDLFNN